MTSFGRHFWISFLAYIPLLIWCFTIFAVSSMSKPPSPEFSFEHADKVIHFGVFGILGFFGALATFVRRKGINKAGLAESWIIAVLYGALDEVHQYFVPLRNASAWDWAADLLGASAGVLFMLLVAKYYYKHKKKHP